MKVIFLCNSILFFVVWCVNGMDNLGDDFLLIIEYGVIDVKLEFVLQMYFRVGRFINIRKIVRLEVSEFLRNFFEFL